MHERALLFLELGGIILLLALAAGFALRIGLSPIPLYLIAGLALGEGGLLPMVTSEEFIDVGAPVGFIRLNEGNYTTSSGGVISMFKRAPHPNTTKVFLNYLLSREGQTLWSQADGGQSARTDVPTDKLNPLRVRTPGVIYPASDDWEFYSWRQTANVEEVAKEIFGPLLK